MRSFFRNLWKCSEPFKLGERKDSKNPKICCSYNGPSPLMHFVIVLLSNKTHFSRHIREHRLQSRKLNWLATRGWLVKKFNKLIYCFQETRICNKSPNYLLNRMHNYHLYCAASSKT